MKRKTKNETGSFGYNKRICPPRRSLKPRRSINTFKWEGEQADLPLELAKIVAEYAVCKNCQAAATGKYPLNEEEFVRFQLEYWCYIYDGPDWPHEQLCLTERSRLHRETPLCEMCHELVYYSECLDCKCITLCQETNTYYIDMNNICEAHGDTLIQMQDDPDLRAYTLFNPNGEYTCICVPNKHKEVAFPHLAFLPHPLQ